MVLLIWLHATLPVMHGTVSADTPEEMQPLSVSAMSLLRDFGEPGQALVLERINALSTLLILELTPSQLYRIKGMLEALELKRLEAAGAGIPLTQIARDVEPVLLERRIPDQVLMSRWKDVSNRYTGLMEEYARERLDYIRGIISILNPTQIRILQIDPVGYDITLNWRAMGEALKMDQNLLRRQGAGPLDEILAVFYTGQNVTLAERQSNLLQAISRTRQAEGPLRVSRAFYELVSRMDFKINHHKAEKTAIRVFDNSFMLSVINDFARRAATLETVSGRRSPPLPFIEADVAQAWLMQLQRPVPGSRIPGNLKRLEFLNLLSMSLPESETLNRLTGEWLESARQGTAALELLPLHDAATEIGRFLLANSAPDMTASAQAGKVFENTRPVLASYQAKKESAAALIGAALSRNSRNLISSAITFDQIFMPYEQLKSFMSMSTLEFRRRKVDMAEQIINKLHQLIGQEMQPSVQSRRAVIRALESAHNKMTSGQAARDDVIYRLTRDLIISLPALTSRFTPEDGVGLMLLYPEISDHISSLTLPAE